MQRSRRRRAAAALPSLLRKWLIRHAELLAAATTEG
jgi:hypothetical protein